MYGLIKEDSKRVWCITAYGKWSNDRTRHYNLAVNVIANTAEEAIEKVKEHSPDVKIVSVSHKGKIDFE